MAARLDRPPQRPPEDSRTGHALGWFALALFLGCAGVSALITGPIFHHDEGSYLLNAAAIAGKLESGLVHGYYSGYSALLVPAYLLFGTFGAIYHYALLLNALLLASVPFALRRILRCVVPSAGATWHALGAAAATCQVALLTGSQQSISENLLIPLYAWLLAGGAALLVKRTRVDAIVVGVLAGSLFLVHPRGATMALPALAALSLPGFRERSLRMPIALMWILAGATALLHVPLESLALKTSNSQIHTYSLSTLLHKLTSLGAWVQVAFNALGVFTYLAVATFGVVLLAWREIGASASMTLRRPLRIVDARDAVLLAAMLGLVASVFVTAVYFNTPGRADQLIYGRYALPTLIPVLAVGIVGLRGSMRGDATPVPAWWAVAITLASIAVIALAFRFLPHPPSDTWVHVNVVDLYIPFTLAGRVDWPTIGFYFCLIAFPLYSLCRVSSRAAAILFALVNVGVAAYVTSDMTFPSNALRARERQAEPFVRAFERATGTPVCISISPGVDAWHGIDYQNWLFDRIDESAVVDRSRCIRGVIAPLNAPSPRFPGYRLVSTDLYNPYGLFLAHSDALARFAATHALPPDDFPHALPESERTANVEITGLDDRTRIRAGYAFAFDTRVTHAGGTVIWPARFDASPLLAVRVAARLDPLDGGDAHVEFRADLPQSLGPGESAATTMVIGPISKPGRYRIEVGTVQEGVAWFERTKSFTITVFDN
jgi:hypothetical protein